VTETQRQTPAQYFPALDGLRGAGVFTMLLYHANVGLASGAFLAISMFFTLSGYLIGGQLYAEFARSGRIDLAGFWERRLRRLMPAATLGLAGAMAYIAVFARSSQVPRFAGDILSALFYVPNWRFIVTGQSYDAIFSTPSPVQHFWSLGVEEQFYLGLPLLFLAVLAKGSARSLAIVIGIVALSSTAWMWALRAPGAPLGHAYFGTDARVAEVLVGVLLALWFASGPRFEGQRAGQIINVLGVLAFATSLVLWWTTHESEIWFYRGGALAYASVTAVVILACIRTGPLQRFLSLSLLVFLGRISYGLYVYHWPIYLALDAAKLGLTPPMLLVTKISLTIVVSTLSNFLIETPIRKRQWLTGSRRWLAPPAVIAGLACMAVAMRLASPTVDPIEEVRIELPELPSAPAAQATSRPGVADPSPLRIMLVGDSMAGNIGRGLATWGTETGEARFAVRSIPGCGLALEGDRRLGKIPADMAMGICRSMQAYWRDSQPPNRYDVLVLLIGTMDLIDRRIDDWGEFRSPGDPVFDDWFVNIYQDTSELWIGHGAKVVFLTYPCSGPEEFLLENMPEDNLPLIAAAAFDIERIRYFNEELLPRVRDLHPDDIKVVDLFEHVCPGGEFVHGIGDVALARDDWVHFGSEGGRELANWLGPQILNALGRTAPIPSSSDGGGT